MTSPSIENISWQHQIYILPNTWPICFSRGKTKTKKNKKITSHCHGLFSAEFNVTSYSIKVNNNTKHILPLVKVNDQFTSTTNTFQLRIVMANWKFLQLERAMLVLRIVASSWHSLKIKKEDVNVEGQRPHKVTT